MSSGHDHALADDEALRQLDPGREARAVGFLAVEEVREEARKCRRPIPGGGVEPVLRRRPGLPGRRVTRRRRPVMEG